MTLKELCKEAHEAAVEKGFWTKFENGELKSRNIPELLMLTVSELGEACEALRKHNRQIRSKNPKWRLSDGWAKDTFEDEIADTFIRLADLCEALDIDIEWQIKNKMEYNKTRPAKHGKAF